MKSKKIKYGIFYTNGDFEFIFFSVSGPKNTWNQQINAQIDEKFAGAIQHNMIHVDNNLQSISFYPPAPRPFG